MLILNKYKEFSYLNLNSTFDFNIPIKNNAFRIFCLFKHSKKLIRFLILVHFYVYCLFPFSHLLFKGSARYNIKLNACLLLLSSSDCYDNYYRF